MIDLFSDLDSNGCYTSNMDESLSWFQSNTNAILITAGSVAALAGINILYSVCAGIMQCEGETGLYPIGLCNLCIFVVQIVLWYYIFATCGKWGDIYSASDTACYSVVDFDNPTHAPTDITIYYSTLYPTNYPTDNPTTISPTFTPSKNPTDNPTSAPTEIPTNEPSLYPTNYPTGIPTTITPTSSPTKDPTLDPTSQPATNPTVPPTEPTYVPTLNPTLSPTNFTLSPSAAPTLSTSSPTITPSDAPTLDPTNQPTTNPTVPPTAAPTFPTSSPTLTPTQPTITFNPTSDPTESPTYLPGTLNYYRIDASENAPLILIAFGTLISFLLSLYLFYPALDDDDDGCSKYIGWFNEHCGSCKKVITRIVALWKIGSLMYTIHYSWQLGMQAADIPGISGWETYQCLVKAFTSSGFVKTIISTAFSLGTQKYIVKHNNLPDNPWAKWDRLAFFYGGVWAVSSVIAAAIFLTNLVTGAVIFFYITLIIIVGYGIVYGLLRFFFLESRAKRIDGSDVEMHRVRNIYVDGDNEEEESKKQRDWVIFTSGVLCMVTVVASVIVIESMVLFYGNSSLWTDCFFIVWNERSWSTYWEASIAKLKRIINLLGMIFS